MRIKNLYNGKIILKETRKDSYYTVYPGQRDYLLLDKMTNIESYFHKMWNKYKFDEFIMIAYTNNSRQRAIASRGLDEIRNYQIKLKEGLMSKAEYYYFNLQNEKRIIKDLAKNQFRSKLIDLEALVKKNYA